MKQNMGLLDRFIRVAIAAFLGAIYLFSGVTGGWAIVLVSIVVVLAITAIAGVCPLYLPFGIDTHSAQEKHSAHNR